MNATAPPADFIEVTDYHNGSESDTNIDEDDASNEYYQPISAAVDSEDEDHHGGNGALPNHSHQLLSNGVSVNQVQRGISSLHLNDDVSSEDEDDREEEEDAAPDSAIMRAFREDENRRNAPLTAENAMRVREAMRGISFAGDAPDWAGRVPEDNWMDRLRQLGRPPQS